MGGCSELEYKPANIVVWDIYNGVVLELYPDKTIAVAMRGNGCEFLKNEEVIAIYGPDKKFEHLKWPETPRQMENAKKAYWVLSGELEEYMLPLILLTCHFIATGDIKDRTYHQFAFDLL